ncbi:MAG TPA: hypothetical protein DCM05_17250 [Elusimicrobia bacterium]|nr:hypothetical protein [Elusimicrobiota bacterium]
MEFKYRFTFPDKSEHVVDIVLEDDTLSLQLKPRKDPPEWTKLGYHQCEGCLLKEKEHPHCPAALVLLEMVLRFKDCNASQLVDIEIHTERHTYCRRGPLSLGMSSLVAVCLPACGCPVLDKIRPMVFTHLPFASLQQNLHRQLANYMLAQYFRSRRGLEPDWEMKGMVALSEDIHTVNRNLCQRISSACPKDATVNSVVHLDCFAGNASLALKRKGLAQIERCFAAYFR